MKQNYNRKCFIYLPFAEFSWSCCILVCPADVPDVILLLELLLLFTMLMISLLLLLDTTPPPAILLTTKLPATVLLQLAEDTLAAAAAVVDDDDAADDDVDDDDDDDKVTAVTMAVEVSPSNFRGLLRGGWSPQEVPVDATWFVSLSILSLF